MPADPGAGNTLADGGLSLAEEVYLVLHYEPLAGTLLRNGKVNGSEAQALAAATLVDLVDDGLIVLERQRRSTSFAMTVGGGAPENPVLADAVAVVSGQRKQRSLTWGLSNLGGSAAVVERLVALGIATAERKPEAPLTPAGLAVLAESRAALDAAVLHHEAPPTDRSALVAAVIHAAKVWRNVYSTKERAEREAIASALTRITRDVMRDGDDRARVIGLLDSQSVAA